MPPLERRFAGVAARQDRYKMIVPMIREIGAALLHPAREIGLADFVG